MKIIIKSVEGGWETERRIELPEDESLVKSILRSVKRKMDELGKPTSEDAGKEKKSEQEQDVPVPPGESIEKREDMEPPAARTVFERPKYRGFILYRCKTCGKVYATNERKPVSNVVCKQCGNEVELNDMVVAELRCPGCGKEWKYQTNVEDADVACRCIACGTEMRAEWSAKKRRYMTK